MRALSSRSPLAGILLGLVACSPAAEEFRGWPDQLPDQQHRTSPESPESPGRHGDLEGARVPAADLLLETLVEGPAVRQSVAASAPPGGGGGVMLDTREAWSAPVGSSFALSTHLTGEAAFTVDLSLGIPSEEGPPPGVRVRFLLELERAGTTRRLFEQELSTGDLSAGGVSAWTSFRETLELPSAESEAGAARLLFSTEFLDPGVPARGALAHWGVPVLSELSGLSGPSETAAPGPLVLMLSVDTLRADHLGCYGYGRETSPAIDRLASTGVLFERCISQSSWTLPSYASLFTSRYPTEHRAGFRKRNRNWLGRRPDGAGTGSEGMRADLPTLAGELRAAGFSTAAIYSNPFLVPARGVLRGFDAATYYDRDAGLGVDLALDWLRRNQGRPGFLFLHLIDPHYPYTPPAPFDTAFAEGEPPGELSDLRTLRTASVASAEQQWLIDQYDGEIAFTDAQLERLLTQARAEGLLDDAITVFNSDHGEEFWEHGGFEHGHSMHDEVLRVPTILHAPRLLPAGLRVSSQVRTIDLFPTILQLLELPIPEGLNGSGLLPLVRAREAGEATQALRAYSEGILWSPPVGRYDEAKALSSGGFKVTLGGARRELRLFDLGADPAEQRDLSEARAGLAAELESRLRARHEELLRHAGVGIEVEVNEEEQRALGQLGYLEDD